MKIEEFREAIGKLFLFLILVIVITSAALVAAPINGFFEIILGEGLQARLEAPLVEEFLKSLGLVTLIVISDRVNESGFLSRLFPDVKLKFLKSMNWVYLIGVFSGGLFGFYENLGSYGFSGFRIATPFLHAIETGFVSIGLYSVIKDGRKGMVKLISTYTIAVSVHFVANNLSLAGLKIYQAIMVLVATIAVLGTVWYSLISFDKIDKSSWKMRMKLVRWQWRMIAFIGLNFVWIILIISAYSHFPPIALGAIIGVWPPTSLQIFQLYVDVPILTIREDEPAGVHHSIKIRNEGRKAARKCVGTVSWKGVEARNLQKNVPQLQTPPPQGINPILSSIPPRGLGGSTCWASSGNPDTLTLNAEDSELLDICDYYRRANIVAILSERGHRKPRFVLRGNPKEYQFELRVTARNARPATKNFSLKVKPNKVEIISD